MKKNKMMRLASCLLVMVLLTTSMISGTFAKYVTTADSSDSARVAKWGFENNTITIENLFAPTYGDTVASADGKDVIAPGTEGSTTINFVPAKGTPEVDYKIDVVATSTKYPDGYTSGNSIIDNPNIKWAFHKNGEAATWVSFGEMLTAIEGISQAKVEANYLPALNDTYVIEWKWMFDKNTATAVDNDVNDTAMGNADSLETIDLTISITATQID